MKKKIAVLSVFVVVIAGRFAAGQSQRDQSFTGFVFLIRFQRDTDMRSCC